VQFLYPIGLLALAGLLIPVLIHLWSTKQGKTLKIGSIALLNENSTSSSKSFKLTDLLLFVLRCLILILIALVIAQPYLKKTSVNTKNKGWVLIDKARLKTIYKTQYHTIDSLLNLGFELRDFNLGFGQFALQDSINEVESEVKLSYNVLLNQLNTEIPSGYSAYLFADRRLNNFDGDQQQLNFKLIWKEVQSPDTLKTWSATFLNKVYEGKSTPKLTSYTTPLPQNLPMVTVAIYDPIGDDSKYIKAALNAISDFTKRKIEIDESLSKADVVFWLSEHALNLPKFKVGANVISYQKGKVVSVNSTLQLSTPPNQTIELKKRIAPDGLNGTAIWTDGYGEPILIKENKTQHFHFYSRFNPQWNDLVWNEQFVKALIPMVLGHESTADFGFEANDADQRVLNKMPFEESKGSTSSGSAISTHQHLDKIIWALAFIVLVIERILSFRIKTNLGYAKR